MQTGKIMKVKVHRNRKTGETFVEYGDSFNIKKYRYAILKNIIESKSEVTLVIDTNQRKEDCSIQCAETFLESSGVKYYSFPAKRNDTQLLGFRIPGKKADEKMIAIEINNGKFSRELYDACLKCYDVAIGFDRQKSFEDTCEFLRLDPSEVIFNTSYFKNSIYDSIVCSSLRSSANIEEYIEAAINEVAL